MSLSHYLRRFLGQMTSQMLDNANYRVGPNHHSAAQGLIWG
jgi:hypothetical protein